MIELSGSLLDKYDPQSDIARDLNSITSALARKDSTLWGTVASAEAAIRLNWIDLPHASMELIPKLDQLRAWVAEKKLNQIILCGMGGSSLAPEVLGKTFGKNIFILDSTDPEQLQMATKIPLDQTVIVIGSKSGSTIETSSQKLFFENSLKEAHLNPKNHLVIVTDPGSPLDISARASGYQVINADPNVGGRFSALSAFGLVPAALMGIDVASLLQDAATAASRFTEQDSNVVKAAALILEQSAQVIAFTDSNSNVPGLSDWIEQLIAESTGKDEVGRLPVVVESAGSEISADAPLITFAKGSGDLVVEGTLAEQFIFWEWVTALLGRGLKVDPFNQPNVTEAKERTSALLAKWNGSVQAPAPSFEDEAIGFVQKTPSSCCRE